MILNFCTLCRPTEETYCRICVVAFIALCIVYPKRTKKIINNHMLRSFQDSCSKTVHIRTPKNRLNRNVITRHNYHMPDAKLFSRRKNTRSPVRKIWILFEPWR